MDLNFERIRNDKLDILRNISVKTFIECGGNSNLMYNDVPIQSNADLIHGLLSYSEWSGVKLRDLFSDDWLENDNFFMNRTSDWLTQNK